MHRVHALTLLATLTLLMAAGGCQCGEPGVSSTERPASPTETANAAPAGAPTAVAKGKLEIRAGSDFPYVIHAVGGVGKVAEGTCNIGIRELPAGQYLVIVKPTGHPAVTLGPVAVKAGEKQTATLGGFGKLRVGAAADFLKYAVKGADGRTVAFGDTNISVIGLQVGTYSVTVTPGKFPPVTLEGVVIKENEQTEAKLMGFGQVTVKGSKDFLTYSLTNAAGEAIATGDLNITTLVLPVGTYELSAGEKKGNPVVVVDGQKINHASGL